MFYPSTPVIKLKPHEGFHFDEVVQAVFVRRFADDHYPGIKDAKVEPGPADASEADSLKKGIMLLGQGRGIFDDKDQNGKRIPETCCAMRMADDLGLRQTHPELNKLFRAVTRVDSTATATSLDMSKLIKAAVRSRPDWLHPSIFKWGEGGVNAIIDYLLLCAKAKAESRKIDCNDYVRPSKVLEDMIENTAIDKRVSTRMREIVSSSEKQVGNCIEMSAISLAMKATGKSDADAYDWMLTGLTHMAEQEAQYLDAKKEILERGRSVFIGERFDGDRMLLLYMETSNVQIANASRAEEFQYAICIVKRPGGNIAILPNEYSKIDMGGTIALIRIMETPSDLRRHADFERYSAPGEIPEAPYWHVMENGTVLHGTTGIKVAVTTSLSPDQIIDIVKCGPTEEAVWRFNELRGGNGNLSKSEIGYLEKTHRKYALLEAKHLERKEHAAPVVSAVVEMDGGTRSDLESAFDKK